MPLSTLNPLDLLVLAVQDAAAAATPAAPTQSKSLLAFIHSGGFLSYVLVTLSVIAVGLIIANLIVLNRNRLAPLHVVGGLERLLKDRQIDGAIKFAKERENESFVATVVGAALSKCARSAFGMLELKTAIEDAGAREVDRLERLNHGIGLCAAVAPMLGLLGTVIGMIGAFSTIGNMEGPSRSAALSGYMSIALVTTAEGLIIAVPCTVAFSLFRRKQDRLVAELGDLCERLCQPVMGPGAVPAAAPAARPAAPVGPLPAAATLPRPVPAPQPAIRGATGS